MFKEIQIGEKLVPMLANGATPLRYKLVFRKDIITEFQLAEGDYSKVTNTIPELAYIMARQATASKGEADLQLLNFEQYLAWMEQFEPMDIILASDAILDVYLGNNTPSLKPKKKVKDGVKES